jgi:hypothetical protein
MGSFCKHQSEIESFPNAKVGLDVDRQHMAFKAIADVIWLGDPLIRRATGFGVL